MKAVWVALALLLTPAAALAQTPPPPCTFTAGEASRLAVGVEYQTIDMACPNSGPSKAHVVRADVGIRGFSFDASTWAQGWRTFIFDLPTAFLQRTGAQVAINANLFSRCCTDYPSTEPLATALCGLEISHGHVLSRADNIGKDCPQGHPFDTSLVVTGRALRIMPSSQVSGAQVAITGSDTLVSNRQNVAPSGSGAWYGNNARSAVGLSETNETLWIAAVDQAGDSVGVTLNQAAQLMIFLGAASALNLDGGGSTALAAEGPDGKAKLLNVPSDRHDTSKGCGFPVGATHCERYVGAVFAIHAPPPRFSH
jgi:hypothetical protein